MVSNGSKHTVLQTRLGYKFQNRLLLDEALRHPSMGGGDNQRLEFLGDRVLGLVIAEALFNHDPDAREGDLAPRYNHLVRKEACAEIADNLQLGTEMQLGRSEAMSGGRRKMALLGDVIEALIAAIYLDGGFEPAREFIMQHWGTKLDELPKDTVDAKTRLQEIVQAAGEAVPTYELVERKGPDHAPMFTVAVKTLGKRAEGTGASKRRAEQTAAKYLLAQIKDKKS